MRSQVGAEIESETVETIAAISDASHSNEAVRILGRISDESGQPVPGAKVKVMRFGNASTSKEAIADGNGIYSFDWEKAETVAISAQSEGYGTQSAIVDLNEGSTSIPLTLPAIHYSQEFEIKADTPELKIELPDKSVSIEIPDPAGALGTTGPIRVEVSSPSAAAGDVPMPGGFMALRSWDRNTKRVPRRSGEAIDTVQLASVAYSEITLRDSAGNEIHELNTPAKVRMKIEPATLNPATNAPFKIGDTIPMWYIDPAAGTWVPEINEQGEQVIGTIVESEGGLAAEFMAKHFTWWNLDQPINTRHCLRGQVVDPCGEPYPEVRVCAKGVSYEGASCHGVYGLNGKQEQKLGSNASFCLDVKNSSTVDLQVGRGGAFYWSTFTFDRPLTRQSIATSDRVATCMDPSTTCTDLGQIVVLGTSPKVVGRIVDHDGGPVAGAIVRAGDRIVTAGADGRFTLNLSPSESVVLSITHSKGPKFGEVSREVSVPGISPQPGKCEELPPVDLGDIPMNTEIGCLRGKVTDEDGNIVHGASLALGGSLIQSGQGGNYCLESLTGKQELNLRFYDRGRGRLHTKKAPYQIVGGGYCGGGDERCVHADIVVDLGDACVSGKVSDQTGKSLDGAVVQVGNQMVTTDKSGRYCIQAAARSTQSVRFRFSSGTGYNSAESEASVSVETSGPGLCSASKKSCTELDQTIQVNQPPEIKSVSALPKRIDPNSETIISVKAADPEGSSLSYRWNSSGGEIQIPPTLTLPLQGGGSSLGSSSTQKSDGGEGNAKEKTTWKAPDKPGVYSVSVTVTDLKGASALESVEISVGRDEDGDGFVSGAAPSADLPVAPGTASRPGADCDDRDPSIHPGVPEICDQVDNDCNGQIDDVPATVVFWRDQDGDGFTDGTFFRGCAVGTGWAQTAKKGDCRDDLKSVAPGSVEICDGLDNDCNGQVDENTDGASCSTGRPSVCSAGTQSCTNGILSCAQRLSPIAEVCDSVDNDCNGQTDENLGGQSCSTDKPGLCSGGTSQCLVGAMTCVSNLNPSAETCDGLDNDCDGIVDKGCECINGKTQACYTGPAGTNGVGYCRAGSQTCASGMWGACAGQKLPAPELCDGTDNDCDGQADEQTGGASCTTGSLGACSEGTQLCTSGSLACAPRLAPSAELCDGLDNDCDGVADESFASLGQACTAGIGECLNSGSLICSSDGTSTICSAEPRILTPESCDSLDNDCDGLVDEDFTNKGQSCLVGLGVCQATGTFQCSSDGSVLICSADPWPPTSELCDTLDNDCDGIIDNGCSCVDGTSRPCYTGLTGTAGTGICIMGAQSCSGGQWGVCSGEITPASETCDGLDNNCNGQVDENTGGASCTTGILGLCSAGTQTCANGALSCAQRLSPTAELCDSLDNDCDGAVDETFSTKGQICTVEVGACQASGALVCTQDGSGLICSVGPRPPTPELCDGLDNDCDGNTDEDFSSKGQSCSQGVGMCQATGVFQCSLDGSILICNADPWPPTPEVCDAFDNDCDGITDEGCNCLDGVTQPCYTGPAGTEGVGLCASGTQTCSSGNWGLCSGQKTPGAEMCDGADNDCDGTVDEETGGGSCSTGQSGVCSAGTFSCSNGALTCAPSQSPGTESCDGLDNDCNGTVDNGFTGLGQTCTVGVGKCEAAGAFICTADGSDTKCSASPLSPAPELCDSLDNDCDGTTDEDFPTKGQTCTVGIGECQNTGTLICNSDSTSTKCSSNPLPPAPEICDGLDNDCDGSTDEDGICIPAAPSDLIATAISSTEIRLTWTDNSNNEDGFVIERKITSTGTYSQLATTAANTTTFTDSGLGTGTEYWYRVRAYNLLGYSAYSNGASARTETVEAARSVSGGWSHSCARNEDSTMKCWGENSGGQLGDGTTQAALSPVAVCSPQGCPGRLDEVVEISTGAVHTCALRGSGEIYCWGDNRYGQLGDGLVSYVSPKALPTAVVGISTASRISCGAWFTCAIIADGTARCWGYNGHGQLGDGTVNLVPGSYGKPLPVTVRSIAGAVEITTGDDHACVLTSDGSVRCWGYGLHGELGNNAWVDSYEPVQVMGISKASVIRAGYNHTCAINDDGSIHCWGFGGLGQLGDGLTYSRALPVKVSGISSTVDLALGESHSCALTTMGNASCWGFDLSGQLGDGGPLYPYPNYNPLPSSVLDLNGAVQIGGTKNHTCARLSDGSVKCWGANWSGQLGDGTTIQRNTPVQVLGLP